MDTIKVAAVQASAQVFTSEADFEQKILNLSEKARDAGAAIAVFPEDIGLWLELLYQSPRVSALQGAAQGLTLSTLLNAPPALDNQLMPFDERLALAPVGFTPAEISMLGLPSLPSWGDVKVWSVVMLGNFFDWLIGHINIPWFGAWLAQAHIGDAYRRVFSRAAATYGLTIVAGSIYEEVEGRIYNICSVFDEDGTECGRVKKKHLIELEKSFGVQESPDPISTVRTSHYNLGVCICYDLNFSTVTNALDTQGAQLLCAGSTGLRPFPRWPYIPEIDAPQRLRAQETELAIVRAYQCGWMLPGIYMDGLSDIVLPDGSVVRHSYPYNNSPDYRMTEVVLTADVPI